MFLRVMASAADIDRNTQVDNRHLEAGSERSQYRSKHEPVRESRFGHNPRCEDILANTLCRPGHQGRKLLNSTLADFKPVIEIIRERVTRARLQRAAPVNTGTVDQK